MHHSRHPKKPAAPLRPHPCTSHSLAILRHTPEQQRAEIDISAILMDYGFSTTREEHT